MNFEEFLKPNTETENIANEQPAEVEVVVEAKEEEEVPEHEDSGDIAVQKAVVESLAADKAEQDEMINSLRKDNYALQTEISSLKMRVAELEGELAKVGDILSANSESELSNKVTLLERNLNCTDRFIGETRDHVLEAVTEARDKAEKEGRVRKAQLLESVLVANEPTGELSKKRSALEKFFAENQNIISGPVIEELQRCGISHKHGEEYLLPSEILKRTY